MNKIIASTLILLMLSIGISYPQTTPAGKTVDINTATKDELTTLCGVGPAIADRIIAGRPYRTVDDLLKVKGIGTKKLQTIKASGAVVR